MKPLAGAWLLLLVIGILIIVISIPSGHVREDERHLGRADVICLGDSLTQGYFNSVPSRRYQSVTFHPYASALEARLGSKYHVLPLGFSGWTSNDLLHRSNVKTEIATEIRHGKPISKTMRPGLDLAIRLYHPVVAIIMAGTNDIFRFKDKDGRAIADRVWKLHIMAHNAGVRTIAIGIPEWSPQRDGSERTHVRRMKIREELNEALQEYAQANEKVATYVPFPFSFRDDRQLFAEDGLHFTPKGYERIGVDLAKYVLPLLKT